MLAPPKKPVNRTPNPNGGAKRWLAPFPSHVPPGEFPGQSLACELYLAEGIRSCEIGSAMFGRFEDSGRFVPASMELVRLAFPRRVYTQSHFDYILEGLADVAGRKEQLRGMRLVYDPPFLRHFTARFEPLSHPA